jgi:hypothetical protein
MMANPAQSLHVTISFSAHMPDVTSPGPVTHILNPFPSFALRAVASSLLNPDRGFRRFRGSTASVSSEKSVVNGPFCA